jgi:carbon starvation protein
MVLHPEVNGPAVTTFLSKDTPMVPMLFVIIACGSISGFHSLVASGTSAKQLNRESSGKLIGAGGMISEGILALLVLMLVASALFWKNAPSHLSQFVFQDLLARGPVIAFGTGFGRAVAALGIPMEIAVAFGILMLNAFVLTSLDTAVRLGRFVFQEALFKQKPVLSNRWIAGLAGVAAALVLAKTNSWNIIWPIFGSANQLIAALALFTVTAYFVGIKRPGRYSMIPALFMWLVTESSLLYLLVFRYAKGFFHNTGDTVLAITAAILAVLGAVVGMEALKSILLKKNLP